MSVSPVRSRSKSWSRGLTKTSKNKGTSGKLHILYETKEREVTVPSKRKRGASGGGSIRKRSDGRWEARYTAGHDPKTGKQIQKSIYGKTQKEVREKLTKTLSEIDEGSYMELSKDSLSHWLDIWLKTYVAHSVKPYTVDAYTRICERHIKPALGRITLDQLESLSIQQFYNALLVEKGLSAKTIKNIHGVLHRALEQAVKLRMLRFNPTELCELPKVTKKEIKPLEEEEVVVMIEVEAEEEEEIEVVVVEEEEEISIEIMIQIAAAAKDTEGRRGLHAGVHQEQHEQICRGRSDGHGTPENAKSPPAAISAAGGTGMGQSVESRFHERAGQISVPRDRI